MAELAALGLEYIIFQAVHDDRFGAFFNSSLHPRWGGSCADAVGVVMGAAATHGIKVWLSCEYTHTDADDVTNATLMAGRRAIMEDLVSSG